MEEIFPGVWREGDDILTLSRCPGRKVYGEKVVRRGGKEYRVWNPYRSKLAAAIKKGLSTWFFNEKSNVLYLGVAEGTTASHISDIVRGGVIVGVDVAPRVFPKLMEVVECWDNILPVLADAGKPKEYEEVVREIGRVDVLYQDVASPDQTAIFLKNMEYFDIKKGYYAIKSRSIDVSKDPAEVYREQIALIEERGFQVLETIGLSPYEKDHAMLVVKRGGKDGEKGEEKTWNRRPHIRAP